MSEQIISVDRMEQAVSLFGNFDENIRLIEEHYQVDVVSRGSDLKVEGDPENVARAVRAIHGLLQLINRGEQLNEQNIRYVLMLVDEGSEEQLPQLSADSICITAKGKPIKAKTLGQKKYVEAIRDNTIVPGVGPAGGERLPRQGGQPHYPHPSRGGGRRKARLPARRPAVEGGSVSASAV